MKHPAHAEDVLRGLEELIEWVDAPFDRTRVYLVGHSAGGHILSSIFLDGQYEEKELLEALEPSDRLLRATQGIVLASGISDPEALLARFPSYDFIPQVFSEPYSRWNTLVYPLRENMQPGTRWHVVHSSGDVLVNLEQSHAMYEHLVDAYAKREWDTSLISKDYDTLNIGHYYTTQAPFASLIGGWAAEDIQRYHC